MSDILWFRFAKRIFGKTRRWNAKSLKDKKIILAIEKLSSNKTFLMLLYTKFLYGTRLITILHLSSRKISFRSFFLFNIISAVIWLFVVIPLGWLAGMGVINLLPAFSAVGYSFIAVFLTIAIFQTTSIWTMRRLARE